MDLFDRRDRDTTALRQIRAWATQAWSLDEDDTLSVAELACHEPGCPPHETVVMIARSGEPTVQHKIGKPAAEVVRGDLPNLDLNA